MREAVVKCDQGNLNGPWPARVLRRVVIVDGSIRRNGGPRTAVLTVDRIYFLARVHGLVVDPGRLHLPGCFCDPTRIYVRIQ